MKSNWAFILQKGNEWASETLYVNPEDDIAKIEYYRITRWGYHDESESEEYDCAIDMEEAVAFAYPDKDAIARLRDCVGDRCDAMIEALEEKNRRKEFMNSQLEVVKNLTISIPAVYVDEEENEYPGTLELSYDRFEFCKDADSPDRPSLSGGLYRYQGTMFPYSVTAGNRKPKILYLTGLIGSEKQGFQFKLTDDDLSRFQEEYGSQYSRFHDQISEYRNSIVEDWVENKSWPGITHPFLNKHHPNRPEVKDLFDLVLGDCGKLRPFVMEKLPWATELITVSCQKGSLSVSYCSNQKDVFTYRETEDAIELKYHDDSLAGVEECRLAYVPDPGSDSESYKPLEQAKATVGEGNIQTMKLRDPFGMSGCFRVEIACGRKRDSKLSFFRRLTRRKR